MLMRAKRRQSDARWNLRDILESKLQSVLVSFGLGKIKKPAFEIAHLAFQTILLVLSFSLRTLNPGKNTRRALLESNPRLALALEFSQIEAYPVFSLGITLLPELL